MELAVLPVNSPRMKVPRDPSCRAIPPPLLAEWFAAYTEAFVGGWNVTANYFYHYVDVPIPFANVDAEMRAPASESSKKWSGRSTSRRSNGTPAGGAGRSRGVVNS